MRPTGQALPDATLARARECGAVLFGAVSSPARLAQLPDVPARAEAGLPNFDTTAWSGLFAPAGTPAAIVNKLGDAMQKAAAQNPELIAKWRSYGGDLKAQTPAEFTAFLRQDSQLWGQAIRNTGLKLD